MGALSTSFNFYVDVEGKAHWKLAILNAVDAALELVVLKTKFAEHQQTFRRADIVATSSILDAVCFALRRVSALVSGEVSSNDV